MTLDWISVGRVKPIEAIARLTSSDSISSAKPLVENSLSVCERTEGVGGLSANTPPVSAASVALLAPLARSMEDARGRVVRWAGLALVVSSFPVLPWDEYENNTCTASKGAHTGYLELLYPLRRKTVDNERGNTEGHYD